MITFVGDERFADLEYVGITHDPVARVLKLAVSSDPADRCDTVVLRDVVAFDVIHFTVQNVVHYLDIARVTSADHIEFVELARTEGATLTFMADIGSDVLLGIVFVPANGASIFALCRSVEKCLKGGQGVYRVAA